jgi:CubicO group peptidase (beta-lactamase class C family)
MKKYKWLSLGLFTASLFLLDSCHVGRFIIWNFADVKDARRFEHVVVHRPQEIFRFQESSREQTPMIPDDLIGKYSSLDDFMTGNKTLALLIIRNDSILFERYYPPLGENDLHPAFSAAKSVVSALVGIAVAEGAIQSVSDPITKYIPEMKDEGMKDVTIDHLLQMRTGFKYNEGYFNPFGNVAKYYYGRNLGQYLPRLKCREKPDQGFQYISAATQLLGVIVERATGKELELYLEEKIWKPLGMEGDATWSIDSRKHSMVKAFCCLNATARDFARFGRLYLNHGQWQGRQIVPEEWVERSIRPYSPDQNFYSSQWWLLGKGRYAAVGFLGQYIVVDPAKNMVVVRLGKKEGDVNWSGLLDRILEQY